MAVYRSVRIFDGRVDAMFKRGGLVWRYWDAKTSEIRQLAREFAPVGEMWHGHTYPPGTLAAGIRKEETRRVSRRQIVFAIMSTANHSIYVIKGTGPIIFGRNGPMWVPLPPTSLRFGRGRQARMGEEEARAYSRGIQSQRAVSTRAGRRVWMDFVAGQDANDFLSEAIEYAKVQHRMDSFESRFRRTNRLTTKRKYPFGF